jgi:hypothetical protein
LIDPTDDRQRSTMPHLAHPSHRDCAPPPRRLARISERPPSKSGNAVNVTPHAGGEHVMQYNARKERVIREIYHRAFVAAGLVDE